VRAIDGPSRRALPMMARSMLGTAEGEKTIPLEEGAREIGINANECDPRPAAVGERPAESSGG
jgi:hypothetical protein